MLKYSTENVQYSLPIRLIFCGYLYTSTHCPKAKLMCHLFVFCQCANKPKFIKGNIMISLTFVFA